MVVMGKRTGEICAKCGIQIKKSAEISMVVDMTYYQGKDRKYKTWYSTLCVDCLKLFIPDVKAFGFKRKKPKIDLGLS